MEIIKIVLRFLSNVCIYSIMQNQFIQSFHFQIILLSLLVLTMSVHSSSRQTFERSNLRSLRSSDVIVKKQERPSFKIYRHDFMHRLFFRGEEYNVNGPESQEFNRRTYEVPIESLRFVNNKNLGFTNQILCQFQKINCWKLFVPVYVSLKVKSIQEISLSDLMARIGTVLVIYINIKDLPAQVVEHLKENILVQINRGQSFLLQASADDGKITLKQKKHYLHYTIRETFPAQIYDDIFLSPFEILNLAFSVTFNSTRVTVEKERADEIMRTYGSESIIQSALSLNSDGKTIYDISFNAMRIPIQLPIFHSSDCKLGVYDLAEQMLDYYATNKPSYSEVITNFQEFLQEEEASYDSKKAKALEQQKNRLNTGKIEKVRTKVPYNFYPPEEREQSPLKKKTSIKEKKHKSKKVKYFQYVHFIVPLYKFPGNGWATIFIPMFMLALLSIFIFLQPTATISQKLGSIATFVLGFIALIPSIKAELPPSQKISFSEIIVYVQSVNSMLSLIDQVFGNSRSKKYSVWTNPLFVISLTIHIICLGASVILLILHYTVWKKRYNLKISPPISSPETDYEGWNNPYCDEVFLKYNNDMKKNGQIEKQVFPWPIHNFEQVRKDKILEKIS